MSLHPEYDESSAEQAYFDEEETAEDLAHRKEVKRRLEARLERKRLKEELEDYEGELDEFDWGDE